MTIPVSEPPVHARWGDLPAAEPRATLTLDLDVDVCVVGGGFAGLTTALEAARRGMSVAVLEGRHVGWAASGHNLGSVLPGYGVPINDLIARVGIAYARELWMLAEAGGEYIRDTIAASALELAMTPGALEVSATDVGDRLLWSSPETTWRGKPERVGRAIRRRIATVLPQLAQARIERVFSSAFGQTVHGMPQIGEMRPGLWVASGFGRQGLNTSAMAGRLIAAGIGEGDDRWRLFSPFELVWAGGRVGRVVGQVV